ncbi:aldehyde ferredoxin oxidoreductase family protein [Paradesulfitobacterium ferrireducens]|uniref:aldehyde ferredoxin oxidoreductase family protein n=1 Tax=Paradesulfitobacterium ferrireducens TaxID=2816476 RepID=UPI001A8D06EB|nr:aldehyde ferredoxin oxidoreductase C-terminal domain-containing protein [Paradesulfitobacterium ferrireducens]
MNKILRVNMTELSIKEEPVKEEYKLLGGRAFIAKLLLDEVKPTCEPLGKHNKLIFAPGLLGGSKVLSSGRISIGGKSPLTGGVKESNGGGVVGIKLGRLRYKGIVVEGLPSSERKYLLKVDANGAALLEAEQYWGLGVYETARKLREKYGSNVAVSCIGPAGENKFLAAGIANTDIDGVPSRYSGRGGLGALMGSKGLKAIVLDDKGLGVLEAADVREFNQAMQDYSKILKESPVVEAYNIYGTAAMVQVTNAVGGLPTRNFSTGKFEWAEKISGERMHDIISERKGKTTHACMPGCMIRCSNVYVDESGKDIVAPLEYETIALMGSNLNIDDLDVIAKLNYLCNDYGLDTIETGAALGVAMAGGLIPFGDQEGALNLVHEIGKGTLQGRVLGMGAETAGKVLGVLNLPVVKGQAMPGYEPRGIKGMGVTYATSPMGADHTAGATARAKVDHNSREGQADLSKKMQYTIPIYDDLGLCMFAVVALGPYPEVLSRLVNSQLGTQLSAEDLFKLADQTVKWEREFNRRAGFTNLDDRLPEYFNETPNPAINSVFDVGEEELDKIHE